MLTDGVGVINGFFALPFWHWGAEAAYNGTILVGLALSGYCMFLLARELGLLDRRLVVRRGGAADLVRAPRRRRRAHREDLRRLPAPRAAGDHPRPRPAPVALVGARTTGRAPVPRASTPATSSCTGSSASALFVVMAWFGRRDGPSRGGRAGGTGRRSDARPRRPGARRASVHASSSVGSTVDVAGSSGQYAPDVVQFFEPSYFQANYRFVDGQLPRLVDADSYYGVFIETSVTIGLVVLALVGARDVEALGGRPQVGRAERRVHRVRPRAVPAPVRQHHVHRPQLRCCPTPRSSSLPGLDFMRVSGAG